MKGLRVLVTAGPTMEAMDPVRYITNHSTEKTRLQLEQKLVSAAVRMTPDRTDQH